MAKAGRLGELRAPGAAMLAVSRIGAIPATGADCHATNGSSEGACDAPSVTTAGTGSAEQIEGDGQWSSSPA
jgi:hypothetical protein